MSNLAGFCDGTSLLADGDDAPLSDDPLLLLEKLFVWLVLVVKVWLL